MTTSRYHRVVLKLSGEAFADQTIGFGIDAVVVQRIAEEVTKARADLEAPGRINDPDGADDVGEICQRFAHAHENDVVDSFAARPFHGDELLHDLA